MKVIAILTLIQILAFSAILTFLISTFVNLTVIGAVFVFCIFLYLLFLCGFIFISQSQEILLPFENYQKQKIIKKAKIKFNKLRPNIKAVVGITGSYGKTTMKETVANILSQKFKVVKTEGNNNTPLGIARTILNKTAEDTEVLVIEMGEYVKGDVAALCHITPPDISIITGINEAHLERYKTMQNAIDTKFEIVEHANPNALVLLNAADELTMQSYKDFVKDDQEIYFFDSKESQKLEDVEIKNYEFDQDGGGISFELTVGNMSFGKLKVPFVADYIVGNIIAGVRVGAKLGMTATEIRLGISTLKPFDHRLQTKVTANNILIIDDTYNGNSNGIKEGLNILKKFTKRRKVYITPGLVETGYLTESIHKDIGAMLAQTADFVILIRNTATKYIADSLIENGFDQKNLVWFEDSKTAWENVQKYFREGDVVLMQNDWSDNYV